MMRGVVCVQYDCEFVPTGSWRGGRRVGRDDELLLQKVSGVARSPQPIGLGETLCAARWEQDQARADEGGI